MNYEQTAQDVLAAVGGRDNVITSTVCMTRLRLSLADLSQVNTHELDEIDGVLGTVQRGAQGIEVVFRPVVLDKLYQRFAVISGASTHEDILPERPSGALRVKISPGRRKSYEAQASATVEKLRTLAKDAAPDNEAISDEDDIDILRSFLAAQDSPSTKKSQPAAGSPTHASTSATTSVTRAETTHTPVVVGATSASPSRKILVLNGPNINMLGIREPDLYGTETFADLIETCHAASDEAGFSECVCYQSNHEGDLVDEIQHAYRIYDGIVFNPGAYTHTSIALLDALKAVQIPCIEVHISDVPAREGYRQISYIRSACFETITGEGIDGYRHAIHDMWSYLEVHSE